MTDKEAYDKLLREQPIVLQALWLNFRPNFPAEMLAERITLKGDSLQLRDLIIQAARHIHTMGDKGRSNAE